MVIIGTGPSGFAAAKCASTTNRSVLVIDSGNFTEPFLNRAMNAASSVFKNTNNQRFLLLNILSLPKRSKIKQLKLKWNQSVFSDHFINSINSELGRIISKAAGGFSEIWGSVLWPLPSEKIYQYIDSERLQLLQNEFFNMLPTNGNFFKFQEKIPYIDTSKLKKIEDDCRFIQINNAINKKGIYAYFSVLATYEDGVDSCMKCELCLLGCTNNSIFSTQQMLNKNWFDKIEFKFNCFVYGLKEEADLVQISFNGPNNESAEINAKRILLAIGPVASARLLLDSRIVEQDIELKDSSVTYGLHLKIPGIFPNRKKTLSEISIYKSGNEQDGHYIQLYNPNISSALAFLGSQRVPSNLTMRLFNYLSDFFVISFFYFPDHMSSKLIVKKNGGIKYRHKNRFFRIHFYLKGLYEVGSAFLKMRIFPLPLVFITKIRGEGMHFGASFPKTKNEKTHFSSDEFGLIMNSQRIHVVDASTLEKIVTGPPTLLLMAHSYLLTEKILDAYE